MESISLISRDNKELLVYENDSVELGFIEVHVGDKYLKALHTEVKPEASGKGVGKKLFTGFIDYARKNNLKVESLCPFISAQLARHADEVKDLIRN